MKELEISADDLVARLLGLSRDEPVCILDSCGVGHLGSSYLIAGIDPVKTPQINDSRELDAVLVNGLASIFTLSYEFGKELLGIPSRFEPAEEFGVFAAQFSNLIVHNYSTGETCVVGHGDADSVVRKLLSAQPFIGTEPSDRSVFSNFSHTAYLSAIEEIRERIREGDTYQTNLTHQLSADLDQEDTAAVFAKLRREHPAPFAAFIKRTDSTVISASPERFLSVDGERRITTAPIKGTRPRGIDTVEDERLRNELLSSGKDIAENTMIVDLLRNDLGRVCEYGSVSVEKLCELEAHPTFFNLVSTISGNLRDDAKPSDILRAMFPCGSITGAPKISTMKIIDEIETRPRGLSMGAIGYSAPDGYCLPYRLDLSVAIRTMVVRDGRATFNVGGGITIDSDPESEWEETLTKARALLGAMNGSIEF